MGKHGFTLAEVLITLGIIGVVAAMTIPTLIADKNDKEIASRLKKTYSILSQAFISASNEYGTPDNWEMDSSADKTNSSIKFGEKFKPYLNIVKECPPNTESCFAHVKYKYLKDSIWGDHTVTFSLYGIQLADGTAVIFEPFDSDAPRNFGETPMLQNIYGSFFVDVNGNRKPNVLGRDVFSFYLSKYGVIPRGTSEQSSSYNFETDCDKTHYGYGCAAWVIYNENLDYLKCDDLSWDGKTKCE